MISTLEISSFRMKEEEKEKRIKIKWRKSLKISTVLDKKWTKNAIFKMKSESKKRNTCSECSMRMTRTSKESVSNRKKSGWMILGRKKTTLKCLISKKQIGRMRWKVGRRGPKISWTRWLIMFFKRWLIDKSLKKICLQSTIMSVKWDRDSLRKKELKD